MKIIGISARYQNDQVVDYHDTMRGVLAQVADFWRTVSCGQLQVTSDAAPTYVIPRDRPAVSETNWIAEAQHAASVFGYTGSHPVVLVSGAGESRGNLGSAGMYVNTLDPKTISHEIGHNLGLTHDGGFHAMSGADLTTSGVNEYGDFSSVMGTSDLDPGALPMHARQRLGWVPPPVGISRASGSRTVVLGDISVSSNALYYMIQRADGLQYTLERYGSSIRLRFSWNSMVLVRAFTINGYWSDPYGGLTFQRVGDSVQITVFEPTAFPPPPPPVVEPPPPPTPPPPPPLPVVLPPPPVVPPVATRSNMTRLHNRFEVRLVIDDPRAPGATAAGTTWGTQTALFSVFQADNLEVVVKILDGRVFNGCWWVFVAGMTDMEFRLEIKDTTSGRNWTRVNISGNLMQSIADNQAFA